MPRPATSGRSFGRRSRKVGWRAIAELQAGCPGPMLRGEGGSDTAGLDPGDARLARPHSSFPVMLAQSAVSVLLGRALTDTAADLAPKGRRRGGGHHGRTVRR